MEKIKNYEKFATILTCNVTAPSKQKRRFGWVVVGLGLSVTTGLMGCGGGAAGGSPASPVTTAPVAPVLSVGPGLWVVMGSSTASGTGASNGHRWSDLVQAGFSNQGVKVDNIARPGAVTYQVLSSASPSVPNRPAPDPAINIDQALSRNPVVILMSFPTNDTVKGYSVEETVANINTLRSTAVSKGIPVLVLSTQPRGLAASQIDQLKQIDTLLSESVGSCFVNVRKAISDAGDHLLPVYDSGDGVHPNDAGHRAIADEIIKTVNTGACFKVKAA